MRVKARGKSELESADTIISVSSARVKGLKNKSIVLDALNLFHKFFRCLDDRSVSFFVNKHLWAIMLFSILLALASLLASKWLWLKGFREFKPFTSYPFCAHDPSSCIRNRLIKSILIDYRKTRDMQVDPSGTHTRFEAGFNMLDSCQGPVLLHYTDPRLFSWWGHLLPLQREGLSACDTPCSITSNLTEADVLVGLLQPPAEAARKEWWQRVAVVNLEAHSISPDAMARTDIFISFHRQADVVVNYFYALRHGAPCRATPDCLHRAVRDSVAAAAPPRARGPRRAKAAMFISARCGRFRGFLSALIGRIAVALGVDSFGRCFNSRREADDPLFDPARPQLSKERIASQYRFHIVAENEVLDDYVTEKFYEGLKTDAVMVYLGAPNAESYAPWPGAFIDALRFASPEALGDYLVALDRNHTAYAALAAPRRAAARPAAAFDALAADDFARADGRSWQCRACAAYARGFCRGGVVTGG